MDKPGFTSGPWHVGTTFAIGPRSNADDQSFGMLIPVADAYGENRVADARLIASAPDLYEALRECEEFFDERADADSHYGVAGHIPNEEMKMLLKVRAALSRAGGQNAE